jgi:hypothetical protein
MVKLQVINMKFPKPNVKINPDQLKLTVKTQLKKKKSAALPAEHRLAGSHLPRQVVIKAHK